MAIHSGKSSIIGYKRFEIKKLSETANVPTKDTEDAGWDLYSDESTTIPAGGTVLGSTGIAMAIPKG